MGMPSPDLWSELVRFIAHQCDLEKMMREHHPDKHGRCPTCRSMGCSLYPAAIEALRLKKREV